MYCMCVCVCYNVGLIISAQQQYNTKGNMSSGLDLKSLRFIPNPMKMWEGQIRERRIKKKAIDKRGDREEDGRLEENIKRDRERERRKMWENTEEHWTLYLQVSQSQTQNIWDYFNATKKKKAFKTSVTINIGN